MRQDENRQPNQFAKTVRIAREKAGHKKVINKSIVMQQIHQYTIPKDVYCAVSPRTLNYKSGSTHKPLVHQGDDDNEGVDEENMTVTQGNDDSTARMNLSRKVIQSINYPNMYRLIR